MLSPVSAPWVDLQTAGENSTPSVSSAPEKNPGATKEALLEILSPEEFSKLNALASDHTATQNVASGPGCGNTSDPPVCGDGTEGIAKETCSAPASVQVVCPSAKEQRRKLYCARCMHVRVTVVFVYSENLCG